MSYRTIGSVLPQHPLQREDTGSGLLPSGTDFARVMQKAGGVKPKATARKGGDVPIRPTSSDSGEDGDASDQTANRPAVKATKTLNTAPDIVPWQGIMGIPGAALALARQPAGGSMGSDDVPSASATATESSPQSATESSFGCSVSGGEASGARPPIDVASAESAGGLSPKSPATALGQRQDEALSTDQGRSRTAGIESPAPAGHPGCDTSAEETSASSGSLTSASKVASGTPESAAAPPLPDIDTEEFPSTQTPVPSSFTPHQLDHPPPPDASGMSPALHPGTMLKAPEMDESSCPTEQFLPWSKAGAEARLAAERGQTPADLETDRIVAAASGAVEAARLMADHTRGQEPSGSAPTRTSRSEVIGRTIEGAVVSLQHARATSLSVVVKPDGVTELSLHFKLQGGQVEALAVLQRGDFKSLNSEWAQLQSRLADHGIRLAPLVSTPHATTSAGGQFFSQKQRKDDGLTPDLPQSITSPSPAPKRSAPPSGFTTGREWWA
jgi:hypothetical protein